MPPQMTCIVMTRIEITVEMKVFRPIGDNSMPLTSKIEIRLQCMKSTIYNRWEY